jgi:uncharacterized protein (DUF58 family)
MLQTNAIAELLSPQLLERTRGLMLVARRVVEGALHGLHRSPLHGLSIEFAEHREYSPGDELKHLDWKVIARSERYVVKQYEQETSLRALIVLDRSRSMAFGENTLTGEPTGRTSKFGYGRILAAALAHLLIEQGDSVGLILATDRITHQVPPRSAPGHILSICRTLMDAEPAGRTDLASALNQLAVSLKRRSLVLLISDLFDEPDGLIATLGQLHHRGHEVVLMHVMDPVERLFDVGRTSGGVTVLRDMETGGEFDAEPHLIQELVRREVEKFCASLEDGAKRYGLHLVRCRTDEPVEQVLVSYLHRRGKMRK